MSDSELEEIEEQLTGQTTVKQLAEFKARSFGDNTTADKVRNNEFTHKELLEYIYDESMYDDFANQFEEKPMTINEARRGSTQ